MTVAICVVVSLLTAYAAARSSPTSGPEVAASG